MKGWKKLLGFVVAVALVSGTSAFTAVWAFSTAQIQRIGPFYTSQVAPDSLLGNNTGGRFNYAMVGGTTDTLLIGDVVYWSDTNKVTKSTTRANYSMIAGVVVGGAFTGNNVAHISSSDVGTQASASNKWVMICKQCRTWMRSGDNGIMIAGRRVLPSDSVAGRFDSSLTASVIDTFYRMIGRTVTATPAAGVGLVDVNIK